MRDHSSRYATNSSSGASAHCMSSKTSTTGSRSASRSKKRRHPANSSACSRSERTSSDRSWATRGRIHARSSASSTALLEGGVELRPRRRHRPRPRRCRAHPDHLGERPVRHAVAVGQAAAAVPGHVLGDAVEVLVELPGKPGLADAGDAGDREQMRLVLVGAGVEELLGKSQLAVAADERRLEALRFQPAGPPGGDAERTPELHRVRLALEVVEAGVGIRDRRFRRPPSSDRRRAPCADRPHPAHARLHSRGRPRPCPGRQRQG